MIDGDRSRQSWWCHRRFKHPDNVFPRERKPHLQQGTLTTPLIDRGQHPKRAPAHQRIVDEIHIPPLAAPGRNRRRAAMQGHGLPALDSHPHLQPFEVVEAMDALPVHVPAFPSQQCTDAARAEARARERDLANAHPQRRLILRATGTVPGRPTESCEPTRVLHTGAKGGHGPQPAEARQLPRADLAQLSGAAQGVDRQGPAAWPRSIATGSRHRAASTSGSSGERAPTLRESRTRGCAAVVQIDQGVSLTSSRR